MHKLKLRHIARVLWFILAMPSLVMLFSYKHDTVYFERIDKAIDDLFMTESTSRMPLLYMQLGERYYNYLLLPEVIISDKSSQMFIFENYEITDEMPLSSARLSLEDELEYKYEFLTELESHKLWSLPNDTRLFTLSRLLLNKSFIEQDTWAQIFNCEQSYYGNGDMFAVYEEMAKILGYKNIDANAWAKDVNAVLTFYFWLSVIQVIFYLYTIVLFIRYLLKNSNRNKETKKHEQCKKLEA